MVTITQYKTMDAILAAVQAFGEEIENEQLVEAAPDTRLYGPRGTLDSMGLVSLLVDVEESINDEFDVSVTLADERAMSQKTSPFRRISTLAKYADMLVDEQLVDGQ